MKFFVLFAVFVTAMTSDISLNDICSGVMFETRPHPTNRNLYIGCVQGKGTLLGCQHEDETFNPFSVSCSTDELPVEPPQDICENIALGWLPHEDNCELFIMCDDSRPHIRQCPEGNIFNRFVPGCVPGDRETCTSDFDTTTEEPNTTEEQTDEPTVTDFTTEELTTPEETSTANLTDETTTIDFTTEETTEMPIDETTDEPTNTPTTIPLTTIPTTTRDPSGDIIVRFVCPLSGSGNIPHQTDCSRYFECINAVQFNRNCPSGLIFDIISRQCGDPETSLCADTIRCGSPFRRLFR